MPTKHPNHQHKCSQVLRVTQKQLYIGITFVTTCPTLDKAKDSRLATLHRNGMAAPRQPQTSAEKWNPQTTPDKCRKVKPTDNPRQMKPPDKCRKVKPPDKDKYQTIPDKGNPQTTPDMCDCQKSFFLGCYQSGERRLRSEKHFVYCRLRSNFFFLNFFSKITSLIFF